MSVGMVAFWGLIIWAIVILARGVGTGAATRRPTDLLADRLARGEITADDYERTRELLESDAPNGRSETAGSSR